ncbi:MAG: tetratricopeptide repeat protein [Phycisphaerae bacterium]|nr:tetratricopeptide repeat protein [Phycisphaerae bacterium]MDW8260926.1 tetratricopeptide repeat protein [Phycisphaerales bacterium]
MRRVLLLSTVVAVFLAGCSSGNARKQPTPKERAVQQWNHARSSVMLGLAQDQYKTGNFNKARQTVNEALKNTPDNAELWILSAKLNIEQGRLEVAADELRRSLELAPEKPEAHYLLGVIHQRWQKLPAALAEYEAASDKAPGELAYVLARAEMLVAMDRAGEALTFLNGRLPYFENNPVIRDAIGQLLMQQRRYAEAAESFRQASLLATDDLGLKQKLARALLFSNRHRESAELLQRILRDERAADRADLYAMLGEACLGADRPAEARSAFETATQLNESSVPAWQGIAKVALNINDMRRAEIAIRRAIAIDPADPQSYLLLGYLRLRQGRPADAKTAFSKASALDQSDAVALCMTGYALEQLGEHDQAVALYAKALRLKPGDELATKLMAQVGMND